MLADWSVECAADDPVLVVPWSASEALSDSSHGGASQQATATGGSQFIDLREDPYALDQIPEAEQNPPLLQALRALNAARSPVFTAKCDAWPLDADELAALQDRLDIQVGDLLAQELDGESTGSACGFASYIDLLWRDRTIFASFHQSEQLLHRLARHVEPIEQPYALLDCVLRPALIDLTSPHEGFAISLYVKALGADLNAAKTVWADALASVVALLRSKDLALA